MGIISITGDLGSGKSTVARKICELTGFDYFSTGTIQRKIAQERGLDTLQLNKLCGSDKSVDDLIDGKLRQMNEDGTTDIVLDSRLAWFFVSRSFKVYITALHTVAADRVFNDDKRKGEPLGDRMKVLENLLERQRMENERFKDFYNADCFNLDNFNLIIDSSKSSVDDIAACIISGFRRFCEGDTSQKRWISPSLPVPAPGCRQDGPLCISRNGEEYMLHSGAEMLQKALDEGESLVEYKVFE